MGESDGDALGRKVGYLVVGVSPGAGSTPSSSFNLDGGADSDGFDDSEGPVVGFADGREDTDGLSLFSEVGPMDVEGKLLGWRLGNIEELDSILGARSEGSKE